MTTRMDLREMLASGKSWTHLMARPLVRVMIGTRIRPNHLTTLRLLFGVGACVGLALGTRSGTIWGGSLWLVSAFLDRADGELARLGKLTSKAGHIYDYYADFACNTLFFVAVGIGLRHSWLGRWAIPLGLLSGICLLVASQLSVWIEDRNPPGDKAYAGRWGFDPDDALYLMAPIAWLGWLSPILVGAAFGTTAIAIVSAIRLWRMVRLDAQALSIP
jgi:archaetidylinositol phosphate synthase